MPGRLALPSAPLCVVVVTPSTHAVSAVAHGLAGGLVLDCVGLVADRVT